MERLRPCIGKTEQEWSFPLNPEDSEALRKPSLFRAAIFMLPVRKCRKKQNFGVTVFQLCCPQMVPTHISFRGLPCLGTMFTFREQSMSTPHLKPFFGKTACHRTYIWVALYRMRMVFM